MILIDLSCGIRDAVSMLRGVAIVMLVGCSHGEKDTLDAVPRAAADALRHEAAGHAIEKIHRETEDGVEVWEASWTVDGAQHEATVTASGEMLEHEVSVQAEDVPVLVRTAAARGLGTPELDYVRLHDGSFEVESGSREIVIAPDGSIVAREDERDDEDDD